MHKLTHWFKSAIAGIFWLTVMGRWRIKDVFNDLYEGHERSETFRDIFRQVFGDQHAVEADPTGLMTVTDLHNLVKYLELAKDQKLVDLACGRGGAGLWVARATGAQLVGLDISDVAIDRARRRIPDFGLESRVEFRVGDFAATGLAKSSFDGAMSVDSLFLVPDKTGSVREVAHILKPGARFVFTTWEVHEMGGIKDYRPMLENAGFRIDVLEQTPRWEEFQRGVHEGVLARQDALIREMGKSAANFWIQGAKVELPKLAHMRRVLIAARKV